LDEVESVEDYVKTYFDMLDDDKDGKLTIDEFRALLESA
jgi:Ca2+-binding EF-hand superfamily protein